MNEKVRKIYP